jgi:hypothetical protein
MNLLHAYRIALIEGLSAREAGVRFGLDHKSIAKCKTRYNLPTLRSEWDVVYENKLAKLSDPQLLSYADTMKRTELNPKHNQSEREVRVLKLLLKKRNLCLK